MARILMSEHSRKVNQKISQVKSAIKALRKLGYSIEISKDVETMYGALVDHVYVVDYLGVRPVFQKHLFTADKEPEYIKK